MSETTPRPEFVTDAMLTYLDELRESGVTNMYGSPRYVQDEFSVDKYTAREVVSYWMRTFSERHPKSA